MVIMGIRFWVKERRDELVYDFVFFVIGMWEEYVCLDIGRVISLWWVFKERFVVFYCMGLKEKRRK